MESGVVQADHPGHYQISAEDAGAEVCWHALQVANSWRTTAGLVESGEPANWDGILRGLDNNAGLGRFAGPGGWNNMDFLAVRA